MGRRPKPKPERELTRVSGHWIEPPDPPVGLGSVGKDYWVKICRALADSKQLTTQMLVPLEALCGQWEIYCHWKWWLQQDLARWTIKTPSGYEIDSPQVRFMKHSLIECNRLWKLLRLAPDKLDVGDTGNIFDIAAEKTRGDMETRPPT